MTGDLTLADGKATLFQTVDLHDDIVLRQADGELDTRRHLCTVRFHLWRLRDDRVVGAKLAREEYLPLIASASARAQQVGVARPEGVEPPTLRSEV